MENRLIQKLITETFILCQKKQQGLIGDQEVKQGWFMLLEIKNIQYINNLKLFGETGNTLLLYLKNIQRNYMVKIG